MVQETIVNNLNEQLTNCRELYINYLNNPFLAENAHQLRVSIRQLRSSLKFLNDWYDKGEYQEINNQLKKTAYVFEVVREIDVLIELCNDYIVKEEKEIKESYDLFNHLTKLRRREMRKVFNKTNRNLADAAFNDTQAFIEQLSRDADSKVLQVTEEELADKLDQNNKKLQDKYNEINLDDYEKTHKIRIKAKNVRYVGKQFKKNFKDELNIKAIIKEAKRIQSELGQVTDAHVNQKLLKNLAKNLEDKNVKKLITLIINEI